MSKKLIFKLYQAVSQAKAQILLTVFGYVSHCKHRPSCGQYAMEQILEHGTISGSLKALSRIITCW